MSDLASGRTGRQLSCTAARRMVLRKGYCPIQGQHRTICVVMRRTLRVIDCMAVNNTNKEKRCDLVSPGSRIPER
jgi:hypothetical protein